MFAQPPVDEAVDHVAQDLLRRGLRRTLSNGSVTMRTSYPAVVAGLLGLSDDAFDRAERWAKQLSTRLRGNMRSFVRERLDDLSVDIIDARWHRWAEREVLEGRDPYATVPTA